MQDEPALAASASTVDHTHVSLARAVSSPRGKNRPVNVQAGQSIRYSLREIVLDVLLLLGPAAAAIHAECFQPAIAGDLVEARTRSQPGSIAIEGLLKAEFNGSGRLLRLLGGSWRSTFAGGGHRGEPYGIDRQLGQKIVKVRRHTLARLHHPVHLQIVESLPLADVAAQAALIGHADLLEHTG